MSFRDYQNCTAKCVVCNDPKELEKEINKIQKKYTTNAFLSIIFLLLL